jgi:hypothetical protein
MALSTPTMLEAPLSSKTSVSFYQTIRVRTTPKSTLYSLEMAAKGLVRCKANELICYNISFIVTFSQQYKAANW